MTEQKLYLPKSFKLEEFKADILEQCRIKKVDLTKNKLLNLLFNDPFTVFKEYQNYTNKYMDIINPYIDEKKLWSYYGNKLVDGLVPIVSSNKNYNTSMTLIEQIKYKNKKYLYKLKKSTDVYKKFSISLLPNDQENEKVSEVVLYGRLVDNSIDPKIKCYIPICQLEKENNIYSLPKYLGMCSYMDFYVVFEIDNNIREIDKFICVDHILLNTHLRQFLSTEHKLFDKMWESLEQKSSN